MHRHEGPIGFPRETYGNKSVTRGIRILSSQTRVKIWDVLRSSGVRSKCIITTPASVLSTNDAEDILRVSAFVCLFVSSFIVLEGRALW